MVLMGIEEVVVEFIDDGIFVFVVIVVEVNRLVENIGVWCFYIVMECVFEELLFMVFDWLGEIVVVNVVFVDEYIGELFCFVDMSWYVF